MTAYLRVRVTNDLADDNLESKIDFGSGHDLEDHDNGANAKEMSIIFAMKNLIIGFTDIMADGGTEWTIDLEEHMNEALLEYVTDQIKKKL